MINDSPDDAYLYQSITTSPIFRPEAPHGPKPTSGLYIILFPGLNVVKVLHVILNSTGTETKSFALFTCCCLY